jgi:hypothetical protein
MNSLTYLRRAVPALTAIATALASTSTSCEASYKPPFIPIVVSINERGELSASFDAAIVTPIGTFSLHATPPGAPTSKDDGLLELVHQRVGEAVKSIFLVRGFGKGTAEIAVTGGSDVRKSGDRKKTRIEIPPGAQQFTLDVDDHDAVQSPSTTSVTTWSEQPPAPQPTTTGSTTTTGPTTTTRPTTTSRPTTTKPTIGQSATTTPPSSSQPTILPTEAVPTSR